MRYFSGMFFFLSSLSHKIFIFRTLKFVSATIYRLYAVDFNFGHFIPHCNEHNPSKYSKVIRIISDKRISHNLLLWINMKFLCTEQQIQGRSNATMSLCFAMCGCFFSLPLFNAQSNWFCHFHRRRKIPWSTKNCFQLICHQSISIR